MRIRQILATVIFIIVATLGAPKYSAHASIILVQTGGGSITDTNADGVLDIFAPLSYDILYDNNDATGGEAGVLYRFDVDILDVAELEISSITGRHDPVGGSTISMVGSSTAVEYTFSYGAGLSDGERIATIILNLLSGPIEGGADLSLTGLNGLSVVGGPGFPSSSRSFDLLPTPSTVPLPSALPLFLGALAGLGGLGAMRRRRKSKAA